MKRIDIRPKPQAASRASADAWVQSRSAGAEPFKRLTIDVPLSLHKRVKSRCALEDVRMADLIRDFLERRFPEGGGGSFPSETDEP